MCTTVACGKQMSSMDRHCGVKSLSGTVGGSAGLFHSGLILSRKRIRDVDKG